MIDKIANILLVEDDYLDSMIIERNLRKMNVLHKLFIARNGQEALDMLRGNGYEKINPLPSIIMLDINMPRMDGLEFLSELRADAAFKDIKVFIMTTSDQEEDRMASQKMGVSGFIVKPFNLNNSSSSKDSFNLFIDLMNLKK